MEILPKWDDMEGMNSFMRLQLAQLLLNTEPASGILNNNCNKDLCLQKKIDYEIKMRDGTAKLLAASKHQNQMQEAAKNLLTSNARMITYMSKLQEKSEGSLNDIKEENGNQQPCNAQISVSGIRIPLMWKDSVALRGKTDQGKYAVFCLWKIGTEINDTSLLTEVDSSMTDIVFEDVINFADIDADFECNFEVYCHKIQEDSTLSSTPRRIRKKFTELSTSVGKRFSGIRDDAETLPDMIGGPKFEKIAHKNLKLCDISDKVETYDLYDYSSNNVNEKIPLCGNFCCRFVAQPDCYSYRTLQAYLDIKTENDDWRSYYCVLDELNISCWKDIESKQIENEYLGIPITQFSQVSHISPLSSERPFCIELFTSRCDVQCMRYIISTNSQEEFNEWWSRMKQYITDQATWQHACKKKVDISPQSKRQGFNFTSKTTNPLSLFDVDCEQAEMNAGCLSFSSMLKDMTVDEKNEKKKNYLKTDNENTEINSCDKKLKKKDQKCESDV